MCINIHAQIIGIVDVSRSGKTTVGRLLLRLYDPTGGRVLIDGQDVREVSQSSLRKHIGVVPQVISQPYLRLVTTYRNVQWFRCGLVFEAHRF